MTAESVPWVVTGVFLAAWLVLYYAFIRKIPSGHAKRITIWQVIREMAQDDPSYRTCVLVFFIGAAVLSSLSALLFGLQIRIPQALSVGIFTTAMVAFGSAMMVLVAVTDTRIGIRMERGGHLEELVRQAANELGIGGNFALRQQEEPETSSVVHVVGQILVIPKVIRQLEPQDQLLVIKAALLRAWGNKSRWVVGSYCMVGCALIALTFALKGHYSSLSWVGNAGIAVMTVVLQLIMWGGTESTIERRMLRHLGNAEPYVMAVVRSHCLRNNEFVQSLDDQWLRSWLAGLKKSAAKVGAVWPEGLESRALEEHRRGMELLLSESNAMR